MSFAFIEKGPTLIVGIISPGTMGSALAAVLVEGGEQVVASVEGRSEETRTAAKQVGITFVPTIAALVECADFVVSTVPQEAVFDAARTFTAAVRKTGRRPVYIDANSVSPNTVTKVCRGVAATGVECVDAAFVGEARGVSNGTTLFVSGAAADLVQSRFGEHLRVVFLGPDIGTASGFKLAFAEFNKGLVALFLEVITAADCLGKRELLSETLRGFYPGTMETVERLLPSYPRHVSRRVMELGEAVEWLSSIGHAGAMASATKTVLEQLADLGLPSAGEWSAKDVWDECCTKGLLLASARCRPGG